MASASDYSGSFSLCVALSGLSAATNESIKHQGRNHNSAQLGLTQLLLQLPALQRQLQLQDRGAALHVRSLSLWITNEQISAKRADRLDFCAHKTPGKLDYCNQESHTHRAIIAAGLQSIVYRYICTLALWKHTYKLHTHTIGTFFTKTMTTFNCSYSSLVWPQVF